MAPEMTARKSPEAWYWSYDIKPDDIDSVLVPGARLVRLSSYRKGTSPRFAALMYQEPGPARRHVLDLEAAATVALLRETGERPVAITVDAGAVPPRFSLVLETGPGPASSLRVDLDEAAARALLDDRHGISDLVTYTTGGVRKYAVIVDERAGPSWLFTGVTARDLEAKVMEHNAAPVRVRGYQEAGRQLFAAVAERADPGTWAWYAALDPDGVARNLERNESYPLDLDATRDEHGLRFSVVMRRSE